MRHLKNIHPESPLIISTKQNNEKDADEDESVDEPEECKETNTGNTNLVSATNAVSVIRGPVIQRVSFLKKKVLV